MRHNIVKINGGFIQARPSFNEANQSWHIWLVNIYKLENDGDSVTLLSATYDNESFEQEVNRWLETWKTFSPTRINPISFEEIIKYESSMKALDEAILLEREQLEKL